MNLYKYSKDLYYGTICGIFLATEEEMQLFFGEPITCYLGEALGKYSEVDLELNLSDFTEILFPSPIRDYEVLKQFEIGFDPLNDIKSEIDDDFRFSDLTIEQVLEDKQMTHLLKYYMENPIKKYEFN